MSAETVSRCSKVNRLKYVSTLMNVATRIFVMKMLIAKMSSVVTVAAVAADILEMVTFVVRLMKMLVHHHRLVAWINTNATDAQRMLNVCKEFVNAKVDGTETVLSAPTTVKTISYGVLINAYRSMVMRKKNVSYNRTFR